MQSDESLSSPTVTLIIAIGIVWLMFLAAGPILLVLLPFGWNFTGTWVMVGTWLVVLTFSLAGLYLISVWVRSWIQGEKLNNTWLLLGVNISVLFISSTLLILLRATLPAPVAVGLAALVSLSLFGFYLSAIIAKIPMHPIRHVIWVVFVLFFAVSIISNTIVLRHEELGLTQEVYQQIQAFDNPALRVIMNIIILASTAISLRKSTKKSYN